MNLKSRKIISMALVFFMMLTILPMAPVTAHAAVGEIETITDEELLEVMEVDLRIGHEIIASFESTSFSKMSNPGHWELKLSKQDNGNRMQYYIVLHLYDYNVSDGYIDFMYDMKSSADPMNSVSFQVSVHGDCQVGFISALTTDKEKVYGSSLDIIFAAGATLRTKQISHQGTGQWGSDIELNLRGTPGEQPGILYTKEITNHYYFIDWYYSDPVTYADNLIIINYDTPPNGGPLFNLGEDKRTYKVQFSETVDLFLNTHDGQFPIFGEYADETLEQTYQYIEDNGITAFSDLRAHLWFNQSGDPADEYTVGDSIDYYFFPKLSMLDFLFKNGINEQFKGNTTSGFKVESSYKLTNLTERQEVASGTVTGIEKEYSYEKDNFVKVAGINGEEYFTFETPGLYELRPTVKLMHNGHTVDSVGEVYHFYVNPGPAVLDGIEITWSAASMAHANGQEFDKSKIEVTAKYSDGSSKILDAAEYDVTYQNGATLKTGDTSVTISYTEDDVTKTATQTVSVADALHAFEFKSLDDLDFGTVEVGYPSVAYKNIIVKNTGSDFINLDYKISDTSKFRLSPYSDDLNAIEEGTSHTLQVHPVDNLPAGVYNETIRVYGMGALAGQEHTFNLKFVVSDGHEHIYTTDFNKSNEFYHWRECTDPACTASDKGRKDVTPHNWDIEHPVVVTPATCTADGVGKIECTICDAYQNTTVYATGHNWGEWNDGDPIITPPCTAGSDLVIERTCNNANCPVGTESKTIGRIHMATEWTTDENAHWKVCGYCNDEIIVPEAPHADSDSDNKCDVCEYDMTPAAPPCTHEYDNDCDATCNKCDDRREVAGHTGGTATCQAPATCTVCGQPYGEKDADNHTGTAEWTKTAETHAKAYNCCEAVVVAEEPHEYDNNQDTTCNECGYERTIATVTCIIKFNSDGGSEVEPSVQNINLGGLVNKPADPTKEGFTFKGWFLGETEYDFTKPVVEGFTLTAKWEAVSAEHTHAWGDVTYTWAEDGSSCTAERVCTEDSTHKETATAAITSAEKTPPTETVKGTTTYTATFTEGWAETQTKDIQDIPVLTHEHTYATEWTTDRSNHWHKATCGHDVITAKEAHSYGGDRVCDICNYKKPSSGGSYGGGSYVAPDKDADSKLRIVMQINNKNILVNGVTKVNDVAPVIVGDRTLVPIRVVTELLGGSADWDNATRTVTLKIDGKTMNMTIGKEIPGFGTSAVIMNDRTYVPVRYVMEKLGAEVEWIGATRQIIIEK